MNLNTSDNKNLLMQAEAGDIESLGKLLEHFRPLIGSLAQRNIEIPTQAEDIVGDTFVIAVGEFESRDKKTSFAVWLLSIFYTVCSSFYELDTKVVYLEEEDFKDLITEGVIPDVVDKHFKQMNNKQKIWLSLNVLDDEQKAVVILYYFANVTSFKQIAQILDIPEKTIQNTLNDARILLSDNLNTPLQA